MGIRLLDVGGDVGVVLEDGGRRWPVTFQSMHHFGFCRTYGGWSIVRTGCRRWLWETLL